jgi:hypothetical protein
MPILYLALHLNPSLLHDLTHHLTRKVASVGPQKLDSSAMSFADQGTSTQGRSSVSAFFNSIVENRLWSQRFAHAAPSRRARSQSLNLTSLTPWTLRIEGSIQATGIVLALTSVRDNCSP